MRSLECEADGAAHWTDETYNRLLEPAAPPRSALVACQGDEVLGFLIAREGMDEWEIENVVVRASHRRQGIGEALLQHLLSVVRELGGKQVFLEVRESNRPARQLYEKFRFSEIGRRARYYSDPEEDAVAYCWMLQPGK